MEIPAVLVELGFLSNRHDASLLKDSAYRDGLAKNLVDGIVAYFARIDTDTVRFHVVQKGETAWSIADQYEVSVGELLEANNLKPDSVLRVGQRIRIR
jgi:N-acetylmuramoyl-L-alanine amidase